MDILKKNSALIVLVILAFFAFKPLTSSGFFPMHDNTQPTRIYEMYQALKDGQFPVRWVKDLGYGYGYPIFNFYAPLPYYFAAMWMFLGLDAIVATKITIAAGLVLAAVMMYVLGNKVWGSWGGFLAGLLYMFAPYHAVEVYVRGALGELWAYAFIPMLVLGLILLYERKFKIGVILGAFALASIILSHTIFGMLAGGFLIIVIVGAIIQYTLKITDGHLAIGLVFLIALGLGLSAFFWLPALTENSLTRSYTLIQGNNDYHNHFVFLDQLWDWPWGFGGSAAGRADGMSFKIGKIHLLLALAAFLLALLAKSKNKLPRNLAVILLISFGFTVFMTMHASVGIWELLPPLAYLQYPWRLLVVLVFCVSLLAGMIGQYLKQVQMPQLKFLSIVFLTATILFFNTKYFTPQYLTNQTANDYTQKEKVQWDISKISDEYLPRNFPVPKNQSEVATEPFSLTNDIIITESDIRSNFWHLGIQSNRDSQVLFSLANYRGWKYFVDTKPVTPVQSGRQEQISVPAGNHIITVYLADTWVRLLGNITTLVSFVIILILLQRINLKSIVHYE